MGTIYIIDVRVIAKRTLVNYWTLHKETEGALKSWYYEAKNAKWHSPQDVKAKFGTASILKGNKVVFNIKGKKYRLVVNINYEMNIVYIKFIGTHKEYDKLDMEEI